MANTQAYFGFRQAAGTGVTPSYEQVVGIVAYNASAIYFGDPVTRQSDGTLAAAAAGSAAIAGIFMGCKYPSVAQKRTVWSNYWPGSDVASTNTVEAYICNDPNAQFQVQCDNGTNPLTSAAGISSASFGANVSFALGTGNANTGISGAYLTSASVAVTASLPFRIVGLANLPPGTNGTAAGAYAIVQVAFNNVETKSLTAVI